jgi:hypothetical protein
MNETMKDHLVNASVKWFTWSLARHIQEKFHKVEAKNTFKRNKKCSKRKVNNASKLEEMKEMEKNLRAEMTILDRNESISHKIWVDLYLIRNIFFRYG